MSLSEHQRRLWDNLTRDEKRIYLAGMEACMSAGVNAPGLMGSSMINAMKEEIASLRREL